MTRRETVVAGVVMLLMLARRVEAAVRFKPGVVLALQPAMSRALPGIEQAHKDAGIARGAVVTSGIEGEHRPDSLHPRGLAVDLRTNDLTNPQKLRLVTALRTRLNGAADQNRPYQAVLERTHLHIEYQPALRG